MVKICLRIIHDEGLARSGWNILNQGFITLIISLMIMIMRRGLPGVDHIKYLLIIIETCFEISLIISLGNDDDDDDEADEHHLYCQPQAPSRLFSPIHDDDDDHYNDDDDWNYDNDEIIPDICP